jgi:hypothetical protein
MKGAKVSKPTARRYYTSWIERNNRADVVIAPFTEEMPIVLPESLPESLTPQADEDEDELAERV